MMKALRLFFRFFNFHVFLHISSSPVGAGRKRQNPSEAACAGFGGISFPYFFVCFLFCQDSLRILRVFRIFRIRLFDELADLFLLRSLFRLRVLLLFRLFSFSDRLLASLRHFGDRPLLKLHLRLV